MDEKLEKFLGTVEDYLKHMPISERIDVIKELKSLIEELQLKDTLSADEIMERLGSPKELAVAYLGERISQGNSFSWKKMMMMMSFYSLTWLSGIIILPSGTIIAGTFMFCGAIIPFIGLIKTVGFLMGYDLPFIQVGFPDTSPLWALPISLIMGIVLFALGKLAWVGITYYVRKVSATHRLLGRR